MLKRLFVQNVALIEKLCIEFNSGFNVLTGETGAGKSILIDAVNLALGERASKELIMSGTDHAVVEASFDIAGQKEIAAILRENELEFDGEITISRELSVSGKNVCRINGTLVALNYLKALTDRLVDVHGQHEHQSLISQSNHIRFLDAFGGEALFKAKERTAAIYAEYTQLKKTRLSGFSSEDERARQIDILTYQIREIEGARLCDGEEAELTEERAKLMNAERILSALHNCTELVSGDAGAASATSSALGELRAIHMLASEYEDLYGKLEGAHYALEDIGFALREMKDSFEYNPARLDMVEQRLEIYAVLKRKYGAGYSEIIAFLSDAQIKLKELTDSEVLRAELDKKIQACAEQYVSEAEKLTSLRKQAAKELETSLVNQLRDLGMERTAFRAVFSELSGFSANGADRVDFMFSANPGEPLKPLEKVASGGELSRIMLAFKAVASTAYGIPTLIFDEIDVGVSGRIATIVGEKMVQIADTHQVICITHLPQIAAQADAHYLVEKTSDLISTRTSLRLLDEEEHCRSIAAMMSGSENTAIGLDHARELIEECNLKKQKRRGN